ncbi:restriction endonuclease subunit S, partial [[Mycoplasma] gypis]
KYFFMSEDFIKSLKSITYGIRQGKKTSSSEIKDFKFFYPIEKEQQKIGSLFQNIDILLKNTEQKTEKMRSVKNFLLKKMFPENNKKIPEIRFKGFNEEWKKSNIDENAFYVSSTLIKEKLSFKSSVPVYDANEKIGFYDSSISDTKYISFIKDGAGAGRTRVLPGKTNILGTMIAILPKKSDIYFLKEIIGLINFSRFILGTTIPHLYYKDFCFIDIKFPSLSEQQKIGSFFQKLDRLIQLYESKKEKQEAIKKALLEKMFI